MLSLAGPIVVSLFSTAAHLLLQLLSYPCDQVVNTFEELIRLLQISTVQASEWHLVRDGGQALVFYDAFFYTCFDTHRSLSTWLIQVHTSKSDLCLIKMLSKASMSIQVFQKYHLK